MIQYNMEKTPRTTDLHTEFQQDFKNVIKAFDRLTSALKLAKIPNPQMSALVLLSFPYYNTDKFTEDELFDRASQLYEKIILHKKKKKYAKDHIVH